MIRQPARSVCITVDMEQDCPPFLSTWRGAVEGTPVLLALLAKEGVPATFFVTGELARRFPNIVRQIVSAGHELGSHGDMHHDFRRLAPEEARADIEQSTATLRQFDAVTSFRAPYLQMPAGYVPFLDAQGYRLDASTARYKWPGRGVHRAGAVLRVPASATSSTLRWRRGPRDWLLSRLSEPAVLFVHPWEFVDLRRAPIPLDCRFKTGDAAVACLRESIQVLRRRQPRFVRMRDYADLRRQA